MIKSLKDNKIKWRKIFKSQNKLKKWKYYRNN